MTLAINDIRTATGNDGVDGAAGASGVDPGESGAAGLAGTLGRAAGLSLVGQTFTGDAGGDQVNVSLTAQGGRGGQGGAGGEGRAAVGTSDEATEGNITVSVTTYGMPGGNGGAGGAGGGGGGARVVFADISADLAGGLAAQNVLSLTGMATGGQAGTTGDSNQGGTSAGDTEIVLKTGPATHIVLVHGTPGGLVPDGLPGVSGGPASVVFRNIAVTGEDLNLQLTGQAIGGWGGGGGSAVSNPTPGLGTVGAPGGDGGNSGDGAAALAQVAGLLVQATLALRLTIGLSADGGQGINGGSGSNAGITSSTEGAIDDGVGAIVTTETHAVPGDGGDGGNGGNATARLTGSTIEGSEGSDLVDIGLRATGGLAGSGGDVAPGVDSSVNSVGDSTIIVNGTPPGAIGADGTDGLSFVDMRGNAIALGAGADHLRIHLRAEGPGGERIAFRGNTLDGGLGEDILELDVATFDETGALVNVRTGRVSVGSDAGGNAMTGFESFLGTRANDRFIDGAGDQSYSGGFGGDRFDFVSGQAGQDSIGFLLAQDEVRLLGFGPLFNTFAKILAATADTAEGALITTGAASSILLAGVLRASLTADHFF